MNQPTYENASLINKALRDILPDARITSITRMTAGVSTAIYRVDTASEQYYLRVQPASDASFAAEVEAHHKLVDLGLRVPEAVHFEERNELIQRSVMLTTAIRGKAVGYGAQPPSIREILRDAGRELAIVNQVKVKGFGWVNRVSDTGELCAEYPHLAMWLDEHFNGPINALNDSYQNDTNHSTHFDTNHYIKVYDLPESAKERFQQSEPCLAHGDFDVTHIYYDDHGYTGIIDFGEIRGAPRFYDLAHFGIENSEHLPHLIQGYTEIAPLPDEAQYDIRLMGTLIAARRIGRCVMQGRQAHTPDIAFVKRTLTELPAHH